VSRAEARLRQSGVLEKRGLVSGVVAQTFAHLQEKKGRADRERAAAAAAGRLQSCTLAGCGAREAHVSHFGKCSACKAAVYCCREHQQADWPAHKAACKAARKADAAAKDAA
jgi:DNA topoisomerase IA